jgi:hypothetical protein
MFNIEAWNKLSRAMQVKHTFQNCKQCQLKYSSHTSFISYQMQEVHWFNEGEQSQSREQSN